MAPTNTSASKTTNGAKTLNKHDISESSSLDGENKDEGFTLSEKQMQSVSLLVRSTVSAAVAQVLPLGNLNSPQNASGGASGEISAHFVDNQRKAEDDDQEDGEVRDEQLDEYEKTLTSLLGDNLVMGPDLNEKVGRRLERCLGSPLDDKVVKAKRDAFPRPANLANLKVPRTNSIIFGKALTDHQNLDRGIQLTQSYLVAGMTAFGRQAEKLLGLRNWAALLDSDERERLPEQVTKVTGMYVDLMDSLILFVRAIFDLTATRRKMFRNDLLDPYKALMEDSNPPSPDWLA